MGATFIRMKFSQPFEKPSIIHVIRCFPLVFCHITFLFYFAGPLHTAKSSFKPFAMFQNIHENPKQKKKKEKYKREKNKL